MDPPYNEFINAVLDNTLALFAFAMRLTKRDAASADDFVQETVRITLDREKHICEEKIRAFMHQTLYRLFLNRRRKVRIASIDPDSIASSSTDMSFATEAVEEFWTALTWVKLSQRLQDLIEAGEEVGWVKEDIAHRLDISRDKLRGGLHDLRRKYSEALQRQQVMLRCAAWAIYDGRDYQEHVDRGLDNLFRAFARGVQIDQEELRRLAPCHLLRWGLVLNDGMTDALEAPVAKLAELIDCWNPEYLKYNMFREYPDHEWALTKAPRLIGCWREIMKRFSIDELYDPYYA